jgi:thiamine kinase-like enzyme
MTQDLGRHAAPLPPDVAAIVERVPDWAGARTVAAAPLPDVIALNNTSYRVTVDGADYVLRVGNDTARFLGVRRADERAALLAAAAAGIAPPVLYADLDGNLVTQLVAGRHWTPEEFMLPANRARVVDTLSRLHAIAGVPADGSAVRRIEGLLASAAELGLPRPDGVEAHLEQLHRFVAQRQADPRFRTGLSHNDFWHNNFLDDGERLWLVDWEFAGDGDPLFDIATFCIGARYDDEQRAEVLRAYGYAEPGDLQVLAGMQRVVFFFEGAWALVQHGLRGSAGYDYAAHAERMFRRLDGWRAG